MENNLPPTSPPSNQPASPPPPTPPPRATAPPPVLPPRVVVEPSRKGRGWKITAIVLIAVLALIVMGNIVSLFQGAFRVKAGLPRAHKPRLEEVTTAWAEKESTDNKIAVIPIEGAIFNQNIGAGGYDLVTFIQDQFKMAARDKDVKAVLLKINSPGGEVLASDDISAAIAKFQQESKKPVVASMSSLAASGGYYVAAPCQWIVAHELTFTGSIGVIMYGFNYRGLLKKVGVQPQVFKSGRFKDMLSGFRDLDNLTPEEQAALKEEEQMVKDLIDQTFKRFKQVVQNGRQSSNGKNQQNGSKEDQGRKLASDWEKYADGRVLSGKDAYQIGFVDELGNFDTAVKRAKTLAAISDANLVQYQQMFDLSTLFRLLGKSEPPTLKLDLGVDDLKLQRGLLYYLCPIVLPSH
jgi:protease IV